MEILVGLSLLWLSCGVLCSQPASEEESISKLLTGKKDPEDQETIAALGIGSLDILVNRLMAEQGGDMVPMYARLIGIKYRQFAGELLPEKQERILMALAAKIAEIEDVRPTSYLIQGALSQLQGIDHSVVRQLVDKYSHSNQAWTRGTAQQLASSIQYRPSSSRGALHSSPMTSTTPIPAETAAPALPSATPFPHARATDSSVPSAHVPGSAAESQKKSIWLWGVGIAALLVIVAVAFRRRV
ncbi:MAG: hypothetical protein ACO1QR_16475 [Chthoniobacteraceae bacterium]